MNEAINLRSCGGNESRIVIGPLPENLAPLIPVPPQDVIVIADANVHRHNLDFINSYGHIIIGQGESIKTLHTVENIYRRLLELGAHRGTFLIGMGGGVVTDITGFAAGTFLRGVRYGFIATTLLGQVDACIGGKNGVNFDGYKNMVGLVSQPEFVICDPAQLKTLSEREFRAGLAEVIKAAVIGDPGLFALLENHDTGEIRGDEALLGEIIARAAKVKVGIVERDEYERGERRKLNLGHTFAHALEKNVPGTLHGEAVAAGVAVISEVAVRLGKLSPGDNRRIRDTITKVGLPTEFPVDVRQLFSALKYDKKREAESIWIAFPTGIGSCEMVKMTIPEFQDSVTAKDE